MAEPGVEAGRGLAVTGWGEVLPSPAAGALEAVLSAFSVRDDVPDHAMLRRMDRLSRLMAAAAFRALGDGGLGGSRPLPGGGERVAVAVGTDLGALDETWAYLERLRDKGPALANPMAFPNLVPNAAAGYLSILAGLTGPSATFTHAETSGEEALLWAEAQIGNGRADLVLAVGGEELGTARRMLRRHLGVAPGPLPGEGAAALILEDPRCAAGRGATPRAWLLGGALGRGPAALGSATHDVAAAFRVVERALSRAGIRASAVGGIVSSPAEVAPGREPWDAVRESLPGLGAAEAVDPAEGHGCFAAAGVARGIAACRLAGRLGTPVLQLAAARGGGLAALVWGPG